MSVSEDAGSGGAARVVEEGAAGSGSSGAGLPTHAARPLVLPETFDGTSSWTDWCFHFDNVAAVNGWSDAQKLQWLRVRLTGRAQKALHRLTTSTNTSYAATRDALHARFEPDSRHTRYLAEFQSRRKRAGEGWADFADDLRNLADKAYHNLQEEACERLSTTPISTSFRNHKYRSASAKNNHPRWTKQSRQHWRWSLTCPCHSSIMSAPVYRWELSTLRPWNLLNK